MPKLSSSSTKPGARKLTGTKENTVHRQKLPLTDLESTLTNSGVQSAEAEFAQLKVEDSTPGSIFESYTSSISLGDQYNEIGASNGKDMIFSTPSQSPGQASHTTTNPPIKGLPSSTANCKAIPTDFVPYTEAWHSSTKIDNSPYSFDKIAEVPDACTRTSTLPGASGINLYDSKVDFSNNPYLDNALPYNRFSNVQDDSLKLREDTCSMFPVSFSSTSDYAYGNSSMSNPQESTGQNPFPYPLGLSMPQHQYLPHHIMNPLKSNLMSVQPCELSLHSQRNLQKSMLDDQIYMPSSSMFSD